MIPTPTMAVCLRHSCRQAIAWRLCPAATGWATFTPCSRMTASLTLCSFRYQRHPLSQRERELCALFTILNARIDHGVQQIHTQIGQYKHQCPHQDKGLHLGIVPLDNGVYTK